MMAGTAFASSQPPSSLQMSNKKAREDKIIVFVNTQAGTMTTKNTNDNDDNEVDFEKRTNVLRAENWLSAASYHQLHPFQRLHLYLNTRTPPAATQNNTFYPLSASFSFI